MDAFNPPDIEPVISTQKMRLTAVIVASALFMQNLDSTVIATGLPAMAKSFHADPLHMSVALTSYLISLSVFVPVSGWAADRFGSRTVFRTAIMVFTLSSIACGLAPSLWFLVAARIVQGLGGAMMAPVGRLVMLRTVSRAQMVAAMSWITMPALIGPLVGPPLGGLIVTYFSWRWIFDINIPIGIIGTIAVTIFIPNVKQADGGGKLDLLGLALTGLALASLMAGLETVGRGIISLPYTLALFGVGLTAGGLYAWHAYGHPHPVLDFSLMRIPTFASSVVAGSFFRIAVGATPFLLPLLLQLAFGESALQSGLTTFATAIGALSMKPAAQPLLRRFGFRTVLIVNGTLAAGFVAISALFSPAWPTFLLAGVLMLSGLFRSLQFTAFNSIAYGDVPRARMSAATSLYSTIQQVTLTLGIVIGAAILETATMLRHHNTASTADFGVAFIGVGLVSALAIPICAMLPHNAGEALSGHHPDSK